jgi:hypothetical protein
MLPRRGGPPLGARELTYAVQQICSLLGRSHHGGRDVDGIPSQDRRWSALQLAFELVKEAPIGCLRDEPVGTRFDHAGFLEEAAQSDASLAEIARRYGIARRVLCRWKQELAAPVFVAVQITDADAPSVRTPTEGERAS